MTRAISHVYYLTVFYFNIITHNILPSIALICALHFKMYLSASARTFKQTFHVLCYTLSKLAITSYGTIFTSHSSKLLSCAHIGSFIMFVYEYLGIWTSSQWPICSSSITQATLPVLSIQYRLRDNNHEVLKIFFVISPFTFHGNQLDHPLTLTSLEPPLSQFVTKFQKVKKYKKGWFLRFNYFWILLFFDNKIVIFQFCFTFML